MAHTSKIEWTEATWNPWHGCHKVSQGCKNCYMFRDKGRYGQDPNVVVRSADKTFYAPLKWQEPRTIFTCSWSDFFIEEADAWRDEAFAIMALTPQHTYQVLTKRPDRMLEYFNDQEFQYRIASACGDLIAHCALKGDLRPRAEKMVSAFFGSDTGPDGDEIFVESPMPLPNVWLGVSVEDQKTANDRIPYLANSPGHSLYPALPSRPPVAFLSIEPQLGPIDFKEVCGNTFGTCWCGQHDETHQVETKIDWVIAGGESGPDARPSHPDWFRSIRDQCTAAGVPFFMKQMTRKGPIPEDLFIREFPNAR